MVLVVVNNITFTLPTSSVEKNICMMKECDSSVSFHSVLRENCLKFSWSGFVQKFTAVPYCACVSVCCCVQAYMDFDIPKEFTAIWKYLMEAYKTEAFRSTMPSDQDIIFHYEKKVGNALQKVKHNPRPTLQSFSYTLDVPEDIAALLNGSGKANGDVSEPLSDGLSNVDISSQPEGSAVEVDGGAE